MRAPLWYLFCSNWWGIEGVRKGLGLSLTPQEGKPHQGFCAVHSSMFAQTMGTMR